MIRENNVIVIESITQTKYPSTVPGIEIGIYLPKISDRRRVMFQTTVMDGDGFSYPRNNSVRSKDRGVTDSTGTRFLLRRGIYFWSHAAELKVGIQTSEEHMYVFYIKIPRD